MDELKEKAHYVSVTGIIRKDNKYLICKRSPNEKAFPNKWCVPGGKIEKKDFETTPKDTSDHWFDIFEKTLVKEIAEETNLKIKNIGYVSNLVFIRPNGFSTIIVSLFADYDSGEVKLSEVFKIGDMVSVSGITKGKGFQGGVKRHGFKGGPKTHGQSDRLRAPGSIGSTTTPGRVYKGKKMAGHMGTIKSTVRGLEVVALAQDNKQMTIKGLVPGYRNNIINIEKQ